MVRLLARHATNLRPFFLVWLRRNRRAPLNLQMVSTFVDMPLIRCGCLAAALCRLSMAQLTPQPTPQLNADPIPRQCLFGAISEIDYVTPSPGCFIQHALPDSKCWAKEWNSNAAKHDRLHPWHCPIETRQQNSLFFFDDNISQIRLAAAPELCVAMSSDDIIPPELPRDFLSASLSHELELTRCDQVASDSQWAFLPDNGTLSGQFVIRSQNASNAPLCVARYGYTSSDPELRAGPCNLPNTCELRSPLACSRFRWVLQNDIREFAAAATAAPASAVMAACLFVLAASWRVL